MIANYADHLSNERTFLAWVRTAIAVVGFGIGATRIGSGQVTGWSEGALLFSGGAVVLIAYLRLRHVRRRIWAQEVFDDDPTVADGLLLALIVALFAMLAIFTVHIS